MHADHELSAIEEVAADWMVERDRGFTLEREREFLGWLRADPRHAATFNALAETWTLIAEAQPVSAAGDEWRMGARSMGERSAARYGRRGIGWRAVGLAAAAAVALMAHVGGWRFGADSETDASAGPAAAYTLAASTDVGVLRTVELPDGSVLQLNTDSAVEVRLEEGVRRVRLTRGEAHFSVAKDRTRPFIVSAGGVDVRVVGTVFNVRLRAESVDVLVTEGKVRVGAPASETQPPRGASPHAETPAELVAGQKLSVAFGEIATLGGTAPVSVTAAEIRQTLAWHTRRLDFDATPLSEIVTEINRYNRHQLVVADPRLNERRFGGSFPADDYETFVRMLEADFAVVAERRGGETWLRLKEP